MNKPVSTPPDAGGLDLEGIRRQVAGIEGREMDAHTASIAALELAVHVPALLAEVIRLRSERGPDVEPVGYASEVGLEILADQRRGIMHPARAEMFYGPANGHVPLFRAHPVQGVEVERLRDLVAQWRIASKETEGGDYEDRSTFVFNDCADDLEAILTRPTSQEGGE